FDPEPITIDDKTQEQGTFVDGGVTPHNNPSLVLFLMAILKPYNIGWELGPDKLTIVSVGTGSHRSQATPETAAGFFKTAKLAIHALPSMMSDAHSLAPQQMQYLRQSPAPRRVNSHVGALARESPPHGQLFRFPPSH